GVAPVSRERAGAYPRQSVRKPPTVALFGCDQLLGMFDPLAADVVADQEVGRESDNEPVEISEQRGFGDTIRPGGYLARLHRGNHSPAVAFENCRDALVIRNRKGVLYSLTEQAVRRIPIAGAGMTGREQRRILQSQLPSQQVGEEVVISIPL